MFTDTVTYTDWNDVERTDTLFFNLSKTDLLGDLALNDRAMAVAQLMEGPQRELTTPEKQEILDVVKAYMTKAYGIKSADGKYFRKTPEIWEDFKSTAAYDKYLYDLFVNPERAFGFITAVAPKDLREQAEREGRLQKPNFETVSIDGQSGEVTPITTEPVSIAPQDDRPDWLKQNRAPSLAELKASDPKWHAAAFELKNQ